MSYKYLVLADCFIDGSLYKPGDERRAFYVSDEKLDPVPAHLREVDQETKAESTGRKAAADNLKKKVKKQQEEIKGASFMTDPNADVKSGGVETL